MNNCKRNEMYKIGEKGMGGDKIIIEIKVKKKIKIIEKAKMVKEI
jgi:hypothetical protein